MAPFHQIVIDILALVVLGIPRFCLAEWLSSLTLPLSPQRRDEEVETRVLAVAVLHCALRSLRSVTCEVVDGHTSV